jgi:Integrase core domain
MTTRKVERFHKTLRKTFLEGTVFADLDEAQTVSDTLGHHYNRGL